MCRFHFLKFFFVNAYSPKHTDDDTAWYEETKCLPILQLINVLL